LGFVRELISKFNIDEDDIKMIDHTAESLQQNHFDLLKEALWNQIRSLGVRVASVIFHDRLDVEQAVPADRIAPATKKRRIVETAEAMDDLYSSMGMEAASPIQHRFENRNIEGLVTPESIVDEEIKRYQRLRNITDPDCSHEDIDKWWGKKQQRDDFPCLAQVAGALFGMKPGSGGLECDIGGMNDIITRHGGSLRPGLVEASVMVKLNKDLKNLNPTTVHGYKATWEAFIPQHPIFPIDYMDDNEDDDEVADGTSSIIATYPV
jgi:hypothetical protein